MAGFLAVVQGAPPRYEVPMLACAAFGEQVRSEIRSQAGGVMREEKAGRDGVLVLRASAGASGMTLEAWYDSLSVWRIGPEGRQAPDTEGLLGGRWRGTLSGEGGYGAVAVPYLPEELQEISDLAGVPNDFLPRLPAVALGPGEGRGDRATFRIRRVPNAADGNQQYAWTRVSASDTTVLHQDTLPVPLRRRTEEEGTLVWDPARGPLRWERRLDLSARLEAKGPIRQAIQTVVRQTIRVVRLAAGPGCG